MGFSAKILADSIAPSGSRLTTFEATYWRGIHSEVLTHKMLSRNSASSRAIPTEKLIQRIVDDPFIPLYIGANKKGMQAGDELAEADRQFALDTWLSARDAAVDYARQLARRGVHKQLCNRIIEPWMWITTIISGTELDNFFALRCHEAAEPHFQKIAMMMRDVRDASWPKVLKKGEYHLPLIGPEDDALIDAYLTPMAKEAPVFVGLGYAQIVQEIKKKVSVGRCARVSYLTHDGRRDISEDVDLHDRLMVQRPLHASPAEHVAMATDEQKWSGNFHGFVQYRKTLPFENVGRAP
jgi:thymidylate synthase ThyX